MTGREIRAYAHRGGALEACENSPAAFASAVGLGFDFLETDVRPTSDGVAVLHHDATLDRTTDLMGPVRQHSWRRVRRAVLGDGQSPWRLEDLLDAFPHAHVNIDLKEAGVVSPALDAIRRTRAWSRVTITSFSTARLRTVRRLTPSWVETSAGPREVVAHRLGVASWHLRGTRLPHRLQVPDRIRGRLVVDAGFLARARARSLAVDVWTVNDAADMRRLLDLGVDGIMTDVPSVLRDVLAERGTWT